MTTKPGIDDRIAKARTRLATNLGALQERMTRARDLVSPSTYLSSPWLKVGAGVAFGLLLGSRRRPQHRLTGEVAAPAPSSGLLRAAITATVTSLARIAIERAVRDLNTRA